jgi:hypothetical protein
MHCKLVEHPGLIPALFGRLCGPHCRCDDDGPICAILLATTRLISLVVLFSSQAGPAGVEICYGGAHSGDY